MYNASASIKRNVSGILNVRCIQRILYSFKGTCQGFRRLLMTEYHLMMRNYVLISEENSRLFPSEIIKY